MPINLNQQLDGTSFWPFTEEKGCVSKGHCCFVFSPYQWESVLIAGAVQTPGRINYAAVIKGTCHIRWIAFLKFILLVEPVRFTHPNVLLSARSFWILYLTFNCVMSTSRRTYDQDHRQDHNLAPIKKCNFSTHNGYECYCYPKCCFGPPWCPCSDLNVAEHVAVGNTWQLGATRSQLLFDG